VDQAVCGRVRLGRDAQVDAASADAAEVHQVELPPLTGSALFDPWRLRYRRLLEGQGVEVRDRRPTKSELLLWEQLRASSSEWFAEVPTKYGYTLDFYCPGVRLAVEVDGASHWGKAGAEHDEKRDAAHERMGIRTKRFSAREVETEVHWVVSEIEALVAQRVADLAGTQHLPAPGPAEQPLAEVPDIPHQPTWSAYLPACRTVLPTFLERNGLYGRLLRQR
jgi:very-short-patch-repair endonuclease